MKKIIKHIIKSCAVISFLAMTLFGCSQAAAPAPVVKTPLKVTRKVTINDKEFDIVTFGQWPQTVKAADVTIDENQTTTNINGWVCYEESDECYYTKVKAEPTAGCGPLFSKETDGGQKNINVGQTYYFKMEPIEWRVLTDDYNGSGKKLLLAENALMAGKFDKVSSTYQDSEIRARLNGLDKEVTSPNNHGEAVRNYNGCGFLQKAFNEIQRGYIADTILTDVGNVTDKIFLISGTDMLNKDYGFIETETSDTARIRENTDYAKATGAWVDINTKMSFWWTRSEGHSEAYASLIKHNGEYSISHNQKTDPATSIVPAICVK